MPTPPHLQLPDPVKKTEGLEGLFSSLGEEGQGKKANASGSSAQGQRRFVKEEDTSEADSGDFSNPPWRLRPHRPSLL